MSNISDHRLALVEKAIDLHGSYLLHYLMGLTKNPHDAEELFDDLWLFVLRRFDEQDIDNLGFLRRKAHQIFVDWWRKQSRNPVFTVEELPEIPVASMRQDALGEQEEAEFKARFFEEYPVELTPEQKEALWLHARTGRTFKEIGEIMGKPSSTVGDWIQQAREAFVEFFNNEHRKSSV